MITIEKNIQLANHTTFKIGGPAKEFVSVKNEQELIEAFEYANKNKLKYYILGGGSNVFFDDRGFDGLIIKLQNTDYEIKENGIECGAGASLSEIVNFAKENNLSGMENLSGIPGTVGGAIRGNAGAFGTETGDLIEKVRVLDISNFESREFSGNDCEFSYRNSIFKANPKSVILSAKLILKAGKKEEILQKMTDVIRKRTEKQPRGWYGSAGSFFTNPVVSDKKIISKFESDTGMSIKDDKLPAGWLIAEVGFLGKKVGNVQVSEKHANFIVNNGSGTAEEVIMLASIIKQKVRSEMGIQLQEEVQFVGF